MRIPSFVRQLTLLLAIFSPVFLRAQFQQPTQEELQMTSDPKAPGAAAVYLNVEEITNDPLHYYTLYTRIKVLTEKGKELATVEIPYESTDFKITDIKARTIHADGTVIPLVGKPDDLLISKTATKNGNLQFSRKVFTLPSVEVGSILEYSYQISYDDNTVSSPSWELQRPYFVHKAHYAFTPFKGFLPGQQNETSSYVMDAHGAPVNTLVWLSLLPDKLHVKADAAGIFDLNLTDIPAAPDEEWMPPISSFLYRVHFYYISAHDTQDFWTSEAKRWSKDVDHFAEPSKSIRDAVNGLIAPGDSDLDKAKKLYKAVQALDNTDFSRVKSTSELKQLKLKVAKHAEDTWAQKSGSSEDIAMLYLTMLRAAGLTAYDMKVVNRNSGIFDTSYLSLDQLQDDIVILNLKGNETALDPGEQMCPFGAVKWTHSGAGGIRQSPDGKYAAVSPLESYPDNRMQRFGDLTLDAHGAVTGNFRFIMSGQQALRWRQAALLNGPDEVKKKFDHWLESMTPAGVEAQLDHFLGLDNPDVNLMAMVNVHGALGTATSKRLLLPGFFFQTNGSHPFVNQEKRLEPVDMQYPEQITDQVIYHLPPGFAVEGAPQSAKISWAGHALYVSASAAAPGQITIARMLARAFATAKPEEYQELRGFYQKVAAADQGELVLNKDSNAKGN